MINWSEGLNDNQREAANTTQGVLLVLAGAGSGKTKMMTHRICHLLQDGIPASEILGITFTNKAAKEMRDRVIKMLDEGAQVPMLTTFHSYGYTLLKRFGGELGYKDHLGICDDDDRKKRIKECLKEISVPGETESVDLSKNSGVYEYVSNVMSIWKDNLYSIDQIEAFCAEADRSTELYLNIALQVYKKYNKELKEENQVDFDDLISKSVELLRIPYIKELLNSEIRHVSVDEFQDTSVAQCELVELLSAPSKEDGSLCVVGDDYQSIYKFRGAKVENILRFAKTHGGCKTVMLGENYRSTGTIVNAAASLISKNTEQLHKSLFSMNEEGDRITVTKFENDTEEAKSIAFEIAENLKKGKSPSDYAVLYRNNAMSRKIEDALLSLSIPYKIFGGVSFYQRREIKDIVAYLRLAAGFNDLVALRRIANVPKRKLGPKAEKDMICYIKESTEDKPILEILLDLSKENSKYGELADVLSSFRRESEQTSSLERMVIKIVNDIDYEKYLEDVSDPSKEGSDFKSRWENVWQLVEKAKEFEQDYRSEHEEVDFQDMLEGFLENIALMTDIDTDKDAEYVSLMTMHKSKGLEFDTVFVIGCADPGSDSDIEEERRLFYVAMTRAKKKLFLSSASSVFRFGEVKTGIEASRFIREIPYQYKETISIKEKEPKQGVSKNRNKYVRGHEYGSYGW